MGTPVTCSPLRHVVGVDLFLQHPGTDCSFVECACLGDAALELGMRPYDLGATLRSVSRSTWCAAARALLSERIASMACFSFSQCAFITCTCALSWRARRQRVDSFLRPRSSPWRGRPAHLDWKMRRCTTSISWGASRSRCAAAAAFVDESMALSAGSGCEVAVAEHRRRDQRVCPGCARRGDLVALLQAAGCRWCRRPRLPTTPAEGRRCGVFLDVLGYCRVVAPTMPLAAGELGLICSASIAPSRRRHDDV